MVESGDPQRFEEARLRVQGGDRLRAGIGTLGEKSLHAILKNYFEPAGENQETRVGGFVADIVGSEGIFVIQTKGFDKLRKKLAAFLPVCPVTVVYPVAQLKWVNWVDPSSGEVVARNRSPRRGQVADVFYELYKIKEFLQTEGLRFCIPLLEVEDYRLLDGWDRTKKRRATRSDRVPTRLFGQVWVSGWREWGELIPPGLPQPFTAKEYAKAARQRLEMARRALNVLASLGLVERAGKAGRAYLYQLPAEMENG